MLQGIAPLALTQAVDLLFGGLQHFRRGTHLGIDRVGNLVRRLSQAPKHRLVPDNIGITHGVGSRGSDLHELHNIVTGVVMVHAQLPHLFQHRNRIDGLGVVEHGINGLIDLPVLL